MLGLPLGSFLLLFLIPGLIVAVMFYGCWRIRQADEERKRSRLSLQGKR